MNRIKQLKTIPMGKKLCETPNLCVEIMNSKRQERRSLVTWYKFSFDVRRKQMLSLPITNQFNDHSQFFATSIG